MTAAVRTPWRPDDQPRHPEVIATIEAAMGRPYVIARRSGRRRGTGPVMRLARQQANGHIASFMLGPTDARNLAAALILAADELENTDT